MRPRAGYFNGELKTYKNLSDKNYLLFVGEPGMGKTNFCNKIEEKIAGLQNHLFLDFKTVKDLGSINHFFVDEVKTKLKIKNEVFVYLDGLDEGILQSPGIASTLCAVLNKELKEYSKQLKLRITCRTADLPKSLESDLKKFYDVNDDESNIYTLCPLTGDNVKDAASVNGINANEFVEAIINKEVVPLAIKPVTLSFLIKLYKKSKSLPNDVTEIYEQGIELLCNEEYNEFRNLAKVDIKKLDVEERFLIAARIAYLLIFCNKSNLEKSDIKGFDEEWNNKPIQVNDKAIEEVLNTQVFTNSGVEISFSHKTYAEFLAAYYLVNNKVDIHALKNLFFNDLGKIHLNPALRQVAIWLSRYNNDFLDLVVQNDFEILFHQGNIQLDDKAKEKLIDAYIKTLLQGEIYNDWKHNFKVLNYKGLADKIIVELKKKTHTGTISFLIQLARFCDDKAKLQDIILDLAVNHSNKHTQIEAVNYLADYGDEIAKEQLIEKLKKEDFKDDDHDEMRAALLKAVYNKMDFDELLTYITNEKKPNHVAAYHYFLSYKFCDYIISNKEHLKKTLIHFSNNIEQNDEVIGKVIGFELVEAAIANIFDQVVENVLVQFIGNRMMLNINGYRSMDGYILNTYIEHFESNILGEINSGVKQQFLEKLIYYLLIKNEIDQNKIIEELTYQGKPIGKDQLNWVLENFQNEENNILQDCWFGFIKKMIPNGWPSLILNYFNVLDEIYNSTSHKEFKKYYNIISKGTVEILRESQALRTKIENIKKESEQRKKDNPRNKKLWIKRINHLVSKEVNKIKSGEIIHWECLVKNKVHSHYVWEEVEVKNRKEIIEAAKIYLANVENRTI